MNIYSQAEYFTCLCHICFNGKKNLWFKSKKDLKLVCIYCHLQKSLLARLYTNLDGILLW